VIGDSARDYASVCAGLPHPYGRQELDAVFATSTLLPNPWHNTAARAIPHSESVVPFLLKTRRIADSHVHFRQWTHSCSNSKRQFRGSQLEVEAEIRPAPRRNCPELRIPSHSKWAAESPLVQEISAILVKHPEYHDEIPTHVGEIFPNPNS
jgi:hypothetical protein